ncbi:NUDIX domain-containing protein [Priestia taiwanensis]|uniref:Nudix hydrolase domain-containing protein n=1 Tax=Priestia taiwanensis TaxID=1347902 RepID=A0A917AX68_9BACI|nr:NUDIX hydrolase [Priestia taiwanensis]MBM7365251.1 putative (di)nucleoside polyphosphate hydrolase [Priestia taiwanensis]GGE85327.1 hypothetical protein GCM10007140_38500 [Priestia taiwanensis]
MIRQAVGAIVEQGDTFLLICKTTINTITGKERIKEEWDFVKGGVEQSDANLEEALMRELEEETGSRNYIIMQQYKETISFDFPVHIKEKIGYTSQKTTMFHVCYKGNRTDLQPKDKEVAAFCFVSKEEVITILTHLDTKDFFLKNVIKKELT